MKKNQNGFGLIEAVLIIIVIAILASVGWIAYKNLTATKVDKVNANTTQNTTQPNQQSTPYKTWLKSITPNEKIKFSYPSTWTVSNKSPYNDQSFSPVYDLLTLTSPTGMGIRVETIASVATDDGSPSTILSATPVATLGGNYFLVYSTTSDSPNTTYFASVETTDQSGGTNIQARNLPANSEGKRGTIDIILFPKTMNFDDPNMSRQETVAQIKSDPSYNDALKIIESFSY